ncbi:MAG: non-canonical purine NTP pyrophosphatase, partial [Gemmataceae bacterium]|nr:non-canonical purine NTP pyrophosphatase [Gemmataceae bacterium]
MPLLIVGTRNRKKREELLDILGGTGIGLADLTSYPDAPEVVEDTGTFLGNASKKATELARHLNAWVLGEDSGLVVPAIGGEPGVDSALYSGTHGADEANNDKLLAKLAGFPPEKRAAHYVCTVAVADPSGEIRATAEGKCHGVIAEERRGSGGFGYDPLFLVPELHKTFGELSSRVKHALS